MNNKLTLPRTAWIALFASLGTISPDLYLDKTTQLLKANRLFKIK